MAIPFYYNPATNELELTADPSPLRTSVGERFGLNKISTRANTLSPTKSYVEKPTYNWEQGDWMDPDDESVGNTKILEDFVITEEMKRKPNAKGGSAQLQEHSKNHSKKHMAAMKADMSKGKSFKEAHSSAMSRVGLGGGLSPKIIENRKRKLYFDLNRDGFMNLFEYLQSSLAQNDYEGYYK